MKSGDSFGAEKSASLAHHHRSIPCLVDAALDSCNLALETIFIGRDPLILRRQFCQGGRSLRFQIPDELPALSLCGRSPRFIDFLSRRYVARNEDGGTATEFRDDGDSVAG